MKITLIRLTFLPIICLRNTKFCSNKEIPQAEVLVSCSTNLSANQKTKLSVPSETQV